MFKHCLPPVGQIRLPFVCFAMEKVGFVQFRNVGCSYFPESRVDCHYTLSSQHNWASSDWIGLFKVPLTRQLAQKSKSISALLPKKPPNHRVWMFSFLRWAGHQRGTTTHLFGHWPRLTTKRPRKSTAVCTSRVLLHCFIIPFYSMCLARIYTTTAALRCTHIKHSAGDWCFCKINRINKCIEWSIIQAIHDVQ